MKQCETHTEFLKHVQTNTDMWKESIQPVRLYVTKYVVALLHIILQINNIAVFKGLSINGFMFYFIMYDLLNLDVQ